MDQNNKLVQNGSDQVNSQILETSFDRKNKRKDFYFIENWFIIGYTSGLELPVGCNCNLKISVGCTSG